MPPSPSLPPSLGSHPRKNKKKSPYEQPSHVVSTPQQASPPTRTAYEPYKVAPSTCTFTFTIWHNCRKIRRRTRIRNEKKNTAPKSYSYSQHPLASVQTSQSATLHYTTTVLLYGGPYPLSSHLTSPHPISAALSFINRWRVGTAVKGL